MSICLTGTQSDVIAANSEIDLNCGFPNKNTFTWADPQQAYQQTFWFIAMPPPEGYKDGIGSWTQDQMMKDVVNVNQQKFDPSWNPPSVLGLAAVQAFDQSGQK